MLLASADETVVCKSCGNVFDVGGPCAHWISALSKLVSTVISSVTRFVKIVLEVEGVCDSCSVGVQEGECDVSECVGEEGGDG